ncbi:MAG: hypothetical protein RLZZ387_4165 [Chloroflexota bacterium]|jgi:hypothetical protein
MSTPTRAARVLALIALLGVSLAACALPGQQATAQPEPGAVGETPQLAVESYPGPGTPTLVVPTAPATVAPGETPPPTAGPGQPTDPAAAVPPAAAPATGGLVGPEWTVAYSGDLNLDGRNDVIAWKPSTVQKGATLSQPLYANYVGTASELVIVHAGADNRPRVMFQGGLSSLAAGDRALVTFPASGPTRPAAFMVQVNSRGVPSLLDVLQVNASGEPYAQGIGIRWDVASQAYRISGAAGK